MVQTTATLTREQILGMPAGRKMDALIEEVFFDDAGPWCPCDLDDPAPETRAGDPVIHPLCHLRISPRYSTVDGAAYKTLIRIAGEEGLSAMLSIEPGKAPVANVGDETASAPTNALAICRALLLGKLED